MKFCLWFFLILSTQVASALPEQGIYSYVNGSQGCPETIDLETTCGGFMLVPFVGGSALNKQKFCAIGKGQIVEMPSPQQRVIRNVREVDNRIHKTEALAMFHGADSITLNSEDSIFPHGNDSFLWEHSEDGKGFSCLYRK